MSNLHINWCWEHSQTTGNDRLVLLAMADSANKETGEVWLSVATVAGMTRVNERTVQRVLKRLIKCGELIVSAGPRQHRPTTYRFTMTSAQTRQTVTPEMDPGVTPGVTPGVSGVTPGASRGDIAVSPEPLRTQETEPLESARGRATTPSKTSKARKSAPRKAAAEKAPLPGDVPLAEVHELVPKKKTADRATRIPQDWMPRQELVDWAKAELGMGPADLKYEHQKFMDHHRSRGNRFVDIGGAWRNWMRKSREFAAARERPAEPEMLFGDERRTRY